MGHLHWAGFAFSGFYVLMHRASLSLELAESKQLEIPSREDSAKALRTTKSQIGHARGNLAREFSWFENDDAASNLLLAHHIPQRLV